MLPLAVAKTEFDLEIERVIQHRIQLERSAALRAGVGAALGIGMIQHFAEHEKVRLAVRRGERVDGRTPVLPESHLDVLDGVNAEAVEARLLDPILVNLRHVRAHVGRFGSEIIQAAQLAQLELGRVVVILDDAVVVKQIGERRVGGIEIERRRILFGRDCGSANGSRRAEI